MDKKKKLIISICVVLLIACFAVSATYAYFLAVTDEGEASTGSGMVGINYTPPADIGGILTVSTDRNGGLFTTTTASLEAGSQNALFNMYITPTSLNNMNIEALKWEAEGLRDTNDDGEDEIVCSLNGNFKNAEVNKSFKIINGCELDYEATTFNIYIWLDANLLSSSISNATFGAKIGADSVDITGTY